MAHNYDVGTKAWQPDVTEGWVASEVVSKTMSDDKFVIVFKLNNGEVRLAQPDQISSEREHWTKC